MSRAFQPKKEVILLTSTDEIQLLIVILHFMFNVLMMKKKNSYLEVYSFKNSLFVVFEAFSSFCSSV